MEGLKINLVIFRVVNDEADLTGYYSAGGFRRYLYYCWGRFDSIHFDHIFVFVVQLFSHVPDSL